MPLSASSSPPAARPRGKSRLPHNFPCPTCGDIFARVDHLSRHLRSHKSERNFICSTCGKGFTRADSLIRHSRCHDTNGNSNTIRNIAARVPRACVKCATSKLRCDGGQPCGRCRDRGMDCQFVQRSRRRVKDILQPSQTYSPESESESDIGEQQQDMRASDFHALDTLSRAAMQAITPPGPGSNIDPNLIAVEHFMQMNSPISAISTRGTEDCIQMSSNVESQATINPSHTQSSPLHHPESLNHPTQLTQTNPQETRGDWSTTVNPLENVSFDVAHFERIGDSNIYNVDCDMGIDFWDTTFDITDWTTMDYAFNVDVPQISMNLDLSQTNLGSQYTTQTFLQPVRNTGSLMPPIMSITATSTANPRLPIKRGTMPTPQQEDSSCPNLHTESTRNTKISHQAQSSSEAQSSRDARLQQHEQWPIDWEPRAGDNAVSFPDLGGTPREVYDAENFSHVPEVTQAVYGSIMVSIVETTKEQAVFRPFLDSAPPPLEAFNCFIQLYFEYFQPVFPLLHRPTFDPSTGPWILTLAVAAIGCRYSKIKDSSKCASALEELLRRVIQHAIERDNSISRNLWLAQSMALNMLGMLYSGDKRLLELALVSKGGMVTTCSRNSALKPSLQQNTIDDAVTGRPLEGAWKAWVREESFRRLGFCCWMLDCQLPLYFDTNPSMGMHEVQQQLPCDEALWDAPSSVSWKHHFLPNCRSGHNPTLYAALESLRSGEPLIPTIGDFGRLVLVYAVWMTTWANRQHSKNPLSPSFHSGDNGVAWQTLATSTLDVLLPNINDIGASSVLRLNLRAHIHHVALLVHVPLSTILAYARAQAANYGVAKAQQDVIIWMQENSGRTARQAVLNAGILFSLIRGQPCHGFYEPIAILIATLTIWAFHQQSQEQIPAEQNEEPRATVRLDRCDNPKAAQAWIDNGANLRGYLTGVGNICGPGAGKRLLQLSCSTMLAMNVWTLNQGFIHVLSTLQMRLGEPTTSK